MAVLKIVEDGDPILKKSCKKVRFVTDEIKQLIQDMGETMFAYKGVGLAANQVGSDYRIITVYDEENEGCFEAYINPRIVKRTDELIYSDEGCLSYPMMIGTVARSKGVEVTAQDLDMKKIKINAEGFKARIFQHETDHLNGISFVERAEEGSVRKLEPEDFEDDEDGDFEEYEEYEEEFAEED